MRANHWVAVLDSLVVSPESRSAIDWNGLHYQEAWKSFVPLGRGLGGPPKPPFHRFRGFMYKYNPRTAGHKHVKMFQEKGRNSCEICAKNSGSNKGPTPLDYLAFYKTGEVFSWTDPSWVAGLIPFDPREVEQPPESPFVIKWICKTCWDLLDEDARKRHTDNEIRWKEYPKRYMYKDPKPGGKRICSDRRILQSRFSSNPQAPWESNPLTPDRRVAQRRHDHGLVPAPQNKRPETVS